MTKLIAVASNCSMTLPHDRLQFAPSAPFSLLIDNISGTYVGVPRLSHFPTEHSDIGQDEFVRLPSAAHDGTLPLGISLANLNTYILIPSQTRHIRGSVATMNVHWRSRSAWNFLGACTRIVTHSWIGHGQRIGNRQFLFTGMAESLYHK
jgi:hypothetical protein